MRLVLFVLMTFSFAVFAQDPVKCSLQVAKPGAERSAEIARPVFTVDEDKPSQMIGEWNGLQFAFVYNIGGAAGPFPMIGIQWTDGKNTHTSSQLYAPGTPIFIAIEIEGKVGTVYAACTQKL